MFKPFRSFIASLAVVAMAGWQLPSLAQTTIISNASLASLQSALNTGGTIILAFDGTITTTGVLEVPFNTVIDAAGRNVTISGGNNTRIFFVDAGITFGMNNVTLSAGHITGTTGANGNNGANGGATGANGGSGNPGGDAQGGAIYNEGTCFLTNVLFVNNVATGGTGGNGGNGGNGSVNAGSGGTGGNGGNGLGGAVYNLGFMFITNCSFAGNSATGGAGGNGGAVGSGSFGVGGAGGLGAMGAGAGLYNLGIAIVANSTFNQNTALGGSTQAAGGPLQPNGDGPNGRPGGAGEGGGLWNLGTNTIINSTFYLNVATGGTGGIGGNTGNGFSAGGNGGTGGEARGGSLFNANADSLAMTNCTFANGSAAGGGGGAAGTGAFPGNPGSTGPASGANIANIGAAIQFRNSILANPTNTTSASGSFTDQGNNISSDSTPTFTTTNSFNNRDPKLALALLAANGGPTLTIGLRPSSPAIDAIFDASAPAIDQRGFARPFGVRSDIGAFEFGASGTNFTLSGRVTVGTNGFQGVTVMAGSASSVTDSNGNFSFLLASGNNFLVSPQPTGFFTPMSTNVLLSTNFTNVIFSGTVNFNNGVATIARSTTNTNAFEITFPAIASTTYRIQASTNLTTTNWVDIATNTATGSVLFFTHTPTNFPFRFFRTVTP